jgi:hypothetical protein
LVISDFYYSRAPAPELGLAAHVTIAEPFRLSLPRPTRSHFYLDIDFSAFTPPRAGAVEAVVALEPPAAPAVEIGRFVPFPAEAFNAENRASWRGFRLDATSIVSKWPVDWPLALVIRLQPLGSGEDNVGAASLTIARVAFADN